jgi:hypothetical protein
LAGVRVLIAATAVALVVSAGAVGSGAAASTAKLPAPLVGAWTRFVTAADWARVGIATEPPEHFSMLVSADGSVIVAESTDVRFAPLSGSRLVISGAYGCGKKKGLYRWRVASGRLTLTKLQDTCVWSVGLYAGVWKREKIWGTLARGRSRIKTDGRRPTREAPPVRNDSVLGTSGRSGCRPRPGSGRSPSLRS